MQHGGVEDVDSPEPGDRRKCKINEWFLSERLPSSNGPHHQYSFPRMMVYFISWCRLRRCGMATKRNRLLAIDIHKRSYMNGVKGAVMNPLKVSTLQNDTMMTKKNE